MDIKKKKFVMISNRGPNFTSSKGFHRSMGGTKEIYAHLVENFCKGWVCLASGELESNNIQSEYSDLLKVMFIKKEKYANYYYKYVSEFLYPALLGHIDRAITSHSTNDLIEISKEMVKLVRRTYGKTDVMICDYHLFKIPALINWQCHKVFLWFIPILTEEYYFPELKEIIGSLSKCDELYLFNDIWCRNYKKAFKHYFPEKTLQTKVRPVMMGPDENYLETKKIGKNDYLRVLKTKLGVSDISNKKFLLSVSRMDFVKNIPLSIKGFEKYLANNPHDKELFLILIAPHHRKDSNVYIEEEKMIKNLVEQSLYKERILLTHDYFEANELRVLFKYVDVFVCPSTFDAVPLTPLEYVLANKGSGAVILSDSIGAYELTFPNCYDFLHDNVESLALAIKQSLTDDLAIKKQRIRNMKSIILEETLQKSMGKIRTFLEKL